MTDSALDARRRRLLFAGVAGAAAISGAGIALWKREAEPAGPAAAETLWPLSFDTPSGTQLAMQSLRGKPLVLNFWATWCPPCVEEMPLLESFWRQNAAKTWQVVGLAIDQPSSVRTFLQKTPVTYPVGMAGLGGTELSKALGNESGGLPFTVVLDAGGRIQERKMGRLSRDEIAGWSSRAA